MADTRPLAPTDAEIDAMAEQYLLRMFGSRVVFNGTMIDFARAVLAKWGADHFADASKTMPLPAGYVLVPVEPTPEMVDAAHEAYMPFGDMALAIQLAIAAAPQAQARSGEPVGYTHASWITAAKRGGGGHFAGRQTPGFDVPLYLASQSVSRKPLTDEQIEAVTAQLYKDRAAQLMGRADDIATARAIERAHGITGGQHGAE